MAWLRLIGVVTATMNIGSNVAAREIRTDTEQLSADDK